LPNRAVSPKFPRILQHDVIVNNNGFINNNNNNNNNSMATTFSSLPIVDLTPLKSPSPAPADLDSLSQRLHDVFATTGFAYLVNTPLSFNHADVFSMAESFFALPDDEKMKLAKRSFRGENRNTYRGYHTLPLWMRMLTWRDTFPPSPIWPAITSKKALK
jgi:hypothetical protein